MAFYSSAGTEATGQIFDQLSDALAAGRVLGEPVTKKGAVRIPVNNLSVRGFMLLRPGGSGKSDTSKPLPRKWVRANTRLMGHIVVGPEGVAWKPRIHVFKVLRRSVFLLISLVALAEKARAS
jgi:hypothetical protein